MNNILYTAKDHIAPFEDVKEQFTSHVVHLHHMSKHLIFGLVISFLLIACKSPFEKVRTSGNPELILKKAFEYYDKGDYSKAQTLFELVVSNLRGRQDSERAYYAYANTFYKLGDYMLASYYFKQYVNTFSNTANKEEALFLSAYCHYLLAPNPKLEQSESLKAIDELQSFTNQYPNSNRVTECNRLIDELRRRLEQKAFAEGELYYNLKQYQSAMLVFENMLRDYPESPDAERVRYLMVKSAFELAQNSVLEKRGSRYGEAVEKAEIFLGKHSGGKYAKEVKSIKKASEEAIGKVGRTG